MVIDTSSIEMPVYLTPAISFLDYVLKKLSFTETMLRFVRILTSILPNIREI
jgi:hypothetical protein